ncbi:D-lactate dehydrogenase [Psychrobacter sp. I-STPA10]|uniref:D-lactate dehydrogenase n=1 Tax=Psychrobacter sp. I-STPA10 TaxID=2585769 RepID=UPI001E439709|nr:D-lactate dehydrogenase [Psychrobacter sp. I-STPA10]
MSSESSSQILSALAEVVGERYLLTKPSQQFAYVQGMLDVAVTSVLAVIIPQSLVALWRAINICATADVIIIAQAANTGLTGGSTPFGAYDRDVVVISMQALAGIYLLNDAKDAIALPAASLQQLESMLAPLGRGPHSVLGSSCVGASIIGGVCNNSGGMLLQRGPAYTQMALFARRNESGKFELINHLGIELGEQPEEMLINLEQGQFVDKAEPASIAKKCSNHQYQSKVRDCDASTPARFNNDTDGLYEASGSAGKLIVFAVRVATFAQNEQEQTYYVSSNDDTALTKLRQQWLKSKLELPILAEYMHRDYNKVTLRYGRDTCLSMLKLSANHIGRMYRLKAKIGYYLHKWHLPKTLPDNILQLVCHFLPEALPKPLRTQAMDYKYHLIIKVGNRHHSNQHNNNHYHNTNNEESTTRANIDNIQAAAAFLQAHAKQYPLALHTCSTTEAKKLLVFRSAATAAMFRYYDLNHHKFGELLSTDIALPRNAQDWDEVLPKSLQQQVKETFYLGHFFCYVMHQDYLLHSGIEAKTFKQQLLNFYNQRHIEYPAEHNVGHMYPAKPPLYAFYKQLDPTNSLNPGIGQTTKRKYWQ